MSDQKPNDGEPKVGGPDGESGQDMPRSPVSPEGGCNSRPSPANPGPAAPTCRVVVSRASLSEPGGMGWSYESSPDPTRKPDRVFIRCHRGHIATVIPGTHEIADDGMISPSLACPELGCDFHATARLAGWPPQ